jgi:hypothetical protein
MNKRISKILESEGSTELKILKLENLALRAFPSSPYQKEVIAAYEALKKEV